jgi:hypothetical protein
MSAKSSKRRDRPDPEAGSDTDGVPQPYRVGKHEPHENSELQIEEHEQEDTPYVDCAVGWKYFVIAAMIVAVAISIVSFALALTAANKANNHTDMLPSTIGNNGNATFILVNEPNEDTGERITRWKRLE